MEKKKNMAEKKKIFVGFLDRFGYELTAAGFTESEVRKTLTKEYIETFKKYNNGLHPKNETLPWGGSSLDSALEEMNIWEMEEGKVEWR